MVSDENTYKTQQSFPSDGNTFPSSIIYDDDHRSDIKKNLKLAWAGDYQSLKHLVSNYIKLDGTWCAPGGEKKIFSDGNTSITWWKNKKFLLFEGKEAENINQLLISLINCDNLTESTNETVVSNESTLIRKGNEGKACSCKCSELSVDLEGVKLDMTIAESKLGNEIQSNTRMIGSVNDELIKIRNEFEKIVQQISHSPNTNEFPEDGVETITRLSIENKVLADQLKSAELNLEACKKKVLEAEEKNANRCPIARTSHALYNFTKTNNNGHDAKYLDVIEVDHEENKGSKSCIIVDLTSTTNVNIDEVEPNSNIELSSQLQDYQKKTTTSLRTFAVSKDRIKKIIKISGVSNNKKIQSPWSFGTSSTITWT